MMHHQFQIKTNTQSIYKEIKNIKPDTIVDRVLSFR